MSCGAVRWLCGIALAAGLGGCLPHQDVTLFGNAEGVSISYVGDVAETMPLARRHCAQYEREPVLRSAKDNTAVYACVRANASP